MNYYVYYRHQRRYRIFINDEFKKIVITLEEVKQFFKDAGISEYDNYSF